MMFTASDYYGTVDGSKEGIAPYLLRACFKAISYPYAAVVGFKNIYYNLYPPAAAELPVPIISVGNLTLGGTGKTPMVAWLARWCQSREIRVGLVSRGYRAADGSLNDEAQVLADALPGVPHVQDPDRVRGAGRLIHEFQCQAVIADDAFQHRRLPRDFDLVLLDAHCPFGYRQLFPRGTLREPIRSLRRADAVVLTRADQVSPEKVEEIRHEVERRAPMAIWSTCCHAPCALHDCQGATFALESLSCAPVAAFCGIGNPSAFKRTLSKLGCEIVSFWPFSDHFPFSKGALDALQREISHLHPQPKFVVCTEKDLVKIPLTNLAGIPLVALAIEIRFLDGAAALQAGLQTKLANAISSLEASAVN